MATRHTDVLNSMPARLPRGRRTRDLRAAWSSLTSSCRTLLREPILHFFAYGAVLLPLGQYLHRPADPYRIVVTAQQEAALADQYAAQFGIRPDPALLRTIVASWVHDEILYREGLALGLDKHDDVVRGRVVQKMMFIMEDVAPPAEPSTAQLEGYYRAHADRYVLPAEASFSHVYFSTQRGSMQDGHSSALARVRQALAVLSAGSKIPAVDLGDAFPDRRDFSGADRSQIERVFGRTPFAEAVFSAPLGRWAGPFESAYGLHLLHVQSRTPQGRELFAQAREDVRADYLRDEQAKANRAAFEHLASKFTIVGTDGATSR